MLYLPNSYTETQFIDQLFMYDLWYAQEYNVPLEERHKTGKFYGEYYQYFSGEIR